MNSDDEARELHELAQQQRKEPVKVHSYQRNDKPIPPPTQLPIRQPTDVGSQKK